MGRVAQPKKQNTRKHKLIYIIIKRNKIKAGVADLQCRGALKLDEFIRGKKCVQLNLLNATRPY